MFEKEYRMLSIVPRWGIAPLNTRQSVAEHSYYVALYTSQICDMLRLSNEDKLKAINYALRHDARECWTTDIPGPIKNAIIDPDGDDINDHEFGEQVNDYRRHVRELDDHFTLILVKLADLVDETFFIHFEELMGNQMLRAPRAQTKEKIKRLLTEIETNYSWGPEFIPEFIYWLSHEKERMSKEGMATLNSNSIPAEYCSNYDEDRLQQNT